MVRSGVSLTRTLTALVLSASVTAGVLGVASPAAAAPVAPAPVSAAAVAGQDLSESRDAAMRAHSALLAAKRDFDRLIVAARARGASADAKHRAHVAYVGYLRANHVAHVTKQRYLRLNHEMSVYRSRLNHLVGFYLRNLDEASVELDELYSMPVTTDALTVGRAALSTAVPARLAQARAAIVAARDAAAASDDRGVLLAQLHIVNYHGYRTGVVAGMAGFAEWSRAVAYEAYVLSLAELRADADLAAAQGWAYNTQAQTELTAARDAVLPVGARLSQFVNEVLAASTPGQMQAAYDSFAADVEPVVTGAVNRSNAVAESLSAFEYDGTQQPIG